jgi:dTDP-4-amino-4,6-dideoxygalactose transaminase
MTSGTWDRHRGHEDSYDVVEIGHNFRLDEPRAALGLSRLPRLADDIERRRAAARRYRARLATVAGVELVGDDEAAERSSHFAFAALFADAATRRRVRDGLAAQGIQTTRYPALHTLSAYAAAAAPGSLPHSEAVAERHLALPLSSHTADADVERIVAAVAAVL